MQLAPATTMHYRWLVPPDDKHCAAAPIYMPTALVLLLLALKPVDWTYRALCG